jgi:hypothetical protein
MKAKVLSLTLIAALLLSLTAAASTVVVEANTGCEGWTVDIGDTASETQAGIQIAGWSSFIGGSAGIGSYGSIDDCRVMWEPPEGDKCATVTYSYQDCTDPTCLKWSALDGQATDDGYKVYVDDTLVFTYLDQVTSETWYPQYVDLTQFELLCQEAHVVKFCATAETPWASFATYGQVAIDWVELGTEACDCCPDCDEPGNRELGLTVEVLEPQCICINISPADLDFGALYPGQTSATQYFQIKNCGTVAVDVTASTTSSFFGSNLWIEGNSWHTVANWILSGLQPGNSQNVGAYVTVPAGYQAGTESGQLILWAEKSTD